MAQRFGKADILVSNANNFLMACCNEVGSILVDSFFYFRWRMLTPLYIFEFLKVAAIIDMSLT